MGFSTLTIRRRFLAYTLPTGVFLVLTLFCATTAHAAPGINQQINFQGRLLNAQGATVPDGYYNMEFKIYQDGDGQSAGDTTGTPAGSLKWTEDYLDSGTTQGVKVVNGFLSVELGSVTPFGTSINWNQDTLWLSMQVGNTATCTITTTFQANCGGDGEMVPMKRLSANAYSLNAGMLGGMTSNQFVQIAQGLQTDSTNSNSIYINKTGTGNIIDLQANGSEAFDLTNTGNIVLGANANHTLSVATAGAAAGNSLTVTAGNAGTGASALAGGNLVLQAGAGGGTNGNGGNVSIAAGAPNGSGVAGNITFTTNGVTRGTFDATNTFYFGNGLTAGTPNNFTITGTASNTTGVSGATLTLQAGNATTGNANGGNLLLNGGTAAGTGTNGLVVIATPTFSTITNDPNCYTGGSLVTTTCTVAQATVDDSSSVLIGFSQLGQTAYLPAPTNKTAGRLFYVSAAPGSSDFSLSVNGGGTGNVVAMRQDTSATMVWNGNAWGAAGASSSTDLQAAYDNTLQSAGGAELIVSHTSNTNGLNIRDSLSNPVNAALVTVQTSSAATLFSVNSHVTEYSSDGGAEVAGGNSSTFPASSWGAAGSATITRYTTVGSYIATGQSSVSVVTTAAANVGVRNVLNTTLTANMHYNVSFAARLASGTFTTMNVYFSIDGVSQSVSCITNKAVTSSIWTKVNCTFAAPSSGLTANNAIIILQSDATVRTFYVDNLSVTIAADYNYATDGGVDDATNFTTNWPAVGGATVTRSTTYGNAASDSAQVVTTAANQGVSNKLSINPLPNNLYRVTVYTASTTSGFNSFTVQYTRDGGTSFVGCADYNTQTISASPTNFTQVTCYITTDGTTATNPYVYFTQTDATARTFFVDTFSMTLSTDTTPNVQIGGGLNGGPATLFTLDRAASAPIASNNDAFLGSMYYDTTLGELQCYEATGWGACGSSPNTVVTISPEYTNAVMHGTGVGTMSSDICSGTLHLNDGTSGQPTICGSSETYNFYKWTSPQASAQTYSIYVTYELPDTFKSFSSGQTSVMGRTDSTNATVQYTIFRDDSTLGLIQCGTVVPVSTGSAASWQPGPATGASDPSTCGFLPSESIVFKIDVIASQNAHAYVGNLNFTFSHK